MENKKGPMGQWKTWKEEYYNLLATIIIAFLCLLKVMGIQIHNDRTKISLYQKTRHLSIISLISFSIYHWHHTFRNRYARYQRPGSNSLIDQDQIVSGQYMSRINIDFEFQQETERVPIINAKTWLTTSLSSPRNNIILV